MQKPIKLKNKNSLEQLVAFHSTCKDEGQKNRLNVIINIKRGKTRTHVATELSINKNTVTDIVKRYNNKGIKGLVTNKGGRPEGNPKWEQKIFDSLVKEINKQDRYWSIPLMQKWLKEHTKQTVPYNTVWYHIKDLNYSYKSARPGPYLGNKEAQAEFKKGA